MHLLYIADVVRFGVTDVLGTFKVSILDHVTLFCQDFCHCDTVYFRIPQPPFNQISNPEICQKGSYSFKVKSMRKYHGRAAHCNINPANFLDSLIVYELTRCGFHPAANTAVTEHIFQKKFLTSLIKCASGSLGKICYTRWVSTVKHLVSRNY